MFAIGMSKIPHGKIARNLTQQRRSIVELEQVAGETGDSGGKAIGGSLDEVDASSDSVTVIPIRRLFFPK